MPDSAQTPELDWQAYVDAAINTKKKADAPDTLDFSPGLQDDTITGLDGVVLEIPQGWEHLPPGDGTLTRRVKKAARTITVKRKRGRKTFSDGVWAPPGVIESERQKLEDYRSTKTYKKRRKARKRRRAEKHAEYVDDFTQAILDFLDFPDDYADLASALAEKVAEHATPVGSGTVARTKRIPIERRAEAATVAYMRHACSDYDTRTIPRVKGARRQVRAEINAESRALLDRYRAGNPPTPDTCALHQAVLTTPQPT